MRLRCANGVPEGCEETSAQIAGQQFDRVITAMLGQKSLGVPSWIKCKCDKAPNGPPLTGDGGVTERRNRVDE